MPRWLKLLLVFLGIFILFVITILFLTPLLHFYVIKRAFDYVVQNFINVTGMSPFLVKGIVIFILIPFVWAILEITKLNVRLFKRKKPTKKLALSIIIFYVGAFFISMFFLGRGTYFGHMKGEVMKYYAVTPEGIRFFDSPGFDPKYGNELKPVTPKLIEHYERAKRGMKPKKIDTSKEIEFFDSITGEPKVWYFIDTNGNYEFFDQPGFHPTYWEELKPVSKEIILDYKKRARQLEEERIKKGEIEEEERMIKEEERRRQEKIATKKVYIEKHINPIISNDPVRDEIAVLIIDNKNGGLSQSSKEMGNKISEKLTNENTKAASNLFKNKFVADGNFEDLYQGDTADISELELKNKVDYIILGKKESSFSQDSRLGDLISCTLHLDLKIYSTQTGEVISSNSFKAAGVGTDNKKAEQQAIERVIEKAESFILDKIKK